MNRMWETEEEYELSFTFPSVHHQSHDTLFRSYFVPFFCLIHTLVSFVINTKEVNKILSFISWCFLLGAVEGEKRMQMLHDDQSVATQNVATRKSFGTAVTRRGLRDPITDSHKAHALDFNCFSVILAENKNTTRELQQHGLQAIDCVDGIEPQLACLLSSCWHDALRLLTKTFRDV